VLFTGRLPLNPTLAHLQNARTSAIGRDYELHVAEIDEKLATKPEVDFVCNLSFPPLSGQTKA
jgi:hypothetical protein